jgi:allantoinase
MSSRLDLIIRGGSVVTPGGVQRVDLGVAEGRIVNMSAGLAAPANTTIDATGLHVFPGILDAHVHFNEPGRTEWEGLTTGSSALAAGGGTWFGDMPLNSLPPVLDAASFAAKKALALQKSVTDFSLWGGLVPGNLDQLAGLREAGAIGLKAFMCASGVDEFSHVDPATLRAGMKRAAQLGLLVAVHAEDNELAAQHTAAARARGTGAATWLASRPIELELAAIRTALELAGETGCALHIVHVSSPEGIALIAAGKKNGVNVTAETCPHYLLLSEDEVLRQGAPAKCAPPLRPESSRRQLWRAVEGEGVDTIGSDHSPAPPDLKTSPDFFAVWGGISGCQHGFPLLLSETLARDAQALPRLARQLAANVAQRFRLPHKGRLAVGFDADFSLLNLGPAHTLQNGELLYRHRQGPYAGRDCSVTVARTVVRGQTVHGEGRIASGVARGQFLRPTA